MDAWLEWARGPAFRFSIVFMMLGLIRHVILTVYEVCRAMRRAGDKSLPAGKILSATIKWLFPVQVIKNRLMFSLTSIVFHIAIIIVPLFLAGHIALWRRGLGISWPAIPSSVADVLSIVAVLSALALVLQRLSATATRSLSRPQDYILPLIVALPFATGLMVMHPAANPFSFNLMMFLHVMSGNLIFVLIPLTKLTHVVLVPSVQLVSEVGWHWPPDAGSRVGLALGKEGKPI